MISSYSFRLRIEFGVFCVPCCVLSVKVKLSVPLLRVYVCILPRMAVPEMTYTVSGGTLNPTHLLAYLVCVL